MKTPDHSNSQTVHEASPAIEVLIPTVGADESKVHAPTLRRHIDRQVPKSPAYTPGWRAA